MNKTIAQRALYSAIAAALGLGLAACDQRPSAEKMGRQIDQGVDKMERKAEQAKDTATARMDEAKDKMSEKTSEAAKSMDDMALTAKVKSALIAEPGLHALAIDVNTKDGAVTLNGSGVTSTERVRAEQVASNVNGVKSVRNNLALVRGT